MGNIAKASTEYFEWIKNTSQFNEESDEGYFLQVSIKKLHELHNDLPFLPKRRKIEKVEKLVANLHDKTEYVIDIGNLKQALKKVHKVIKFNQNAWLKPYLL